MNGHNRYTCVPSILNCPPTSLSTLPFQVVTEHGFGCPASYIKLAPVIHFTYGNTYVSLLFSQIILPSPSPTESKSLFFTSLAPLLPNRIIGTIFLYSIHMHEYTVLVFLFLTNFTIYDRLYVHPPH